MIKSIISKPMAVEADTDQEVSLQVAKTTVTDSEGERETSPDVCLCVGSGRKAVAVFFTVEQTSLLIRQLEYMRSVAQNWGKEVSLK